MNSSPTSSFRPPSVLTDAQIAPITHLLLSRLFDAVPQRLKEAKANYAASVLDDTKAEIPQAQITRTLGYQHRSGVTSLRNGTYTEDKLFLLKNFVGEPRRLFYPNDADLLTELLCDLISYAAENLIPTLFGMQAQVGTMTTDDFMLLEQFAKSSDAWYHACESNNIIAQREVHAQVIEAVRFHLQDQTAMHTLEHFRDTLRVWFPAYTLVRLCLTQLSASSVRL